MASATPNSAAFHIARQGDCILSIAAEHGHDAREIWGLEANRTLHEPDAAFKRQILKPGTKVYLPEKSARREGRSPEATHKFRLLNTPVQIRVRFLDNGSPRAGVAYIFECGQIRREGATDADGTLIETVPTTATEAKVRLGPAGSGEDYVLQIGHMDPITTVSGVQARLRNLGFRPGPIDDKLGPRTAGALRSFQRAAKIKVTGAIDEDTRRELEAAHGC